MDSYVASCYIENNDGQYHMDCDMQINDKSVYAEYSGTNFVEGINSLMDDLTKQMSAKSEPQMTPEEKIESLQKQIEELNKENGKLKDKINNLSKKSNVKLNDAVLTSDYLNNLIDEWLKSYENKPIKIVY